MRKMIKYLGAAAGTLAVALSAGCTASRQAASSPYYDNMYGTTDRQAIARAERRQAELERAEAEARLMSIDRMLVDADTPEGILLENPDDSYLEGYRDGYESAYLRRLRMFEEPDYILPTSYYDYYYDTALFLTGAYLASWNYWNSPYYWSPGFYFGSYYSPYWGWNWGLHWGWGAGWGWYPGWSHPGWHDHWHHHWHGDPYYTYRPNSNPRSRYGYSRTHRATRPPRAALRRAAASAPAPPHREAALLHP